MYACMHAYMHGCMYVCMYVRMYVCMYACIYIYIYVLYVYFYTLYIYIYIHKKKSPVDFPKWWMLHLEMVVTARKPRNAVEKAAKDKGQQGQQATLPVLNTAQEPLVKCLALA